MTVELSTTYLGLELSCPIVASAGPLTGRIDTLERLVAAGVGAVVLPSLFEEEVVEAALREHSMRSQGVEVFAEAMTYLPEPRSYEGPVERYLELLERARGLGVPVVASLNGTTNGGWVGYAVDLAEAGASAIELNVYLVAADPDETAVDVEDRLLELVSAVRAAVSVPVAVKLSPYFSALGSLASRLVRVGADGLVLFNRWAQPDLDLDDLAIVPALELSTPADLRMPLRWIGILRGRVGCSLALSGGVHGPDGVVKGLLVGADVVMSTSGLLRHGPEHVAVLRAGLVRWLEEHDYESVTELRGAMSQRSVPDPDAFERAGYLSTLQQAMRRYAASPVARW